MDVPSGFHLRAARPPVSLDKSSLKRGVLLKLGLGCFGGGDHTQSTGGKL